MQLFFGRERKIRQVFKVLKSGSSVALIGEEAEEPVETRNFASLHNGFLLADRL